MERTGRCMCGAVTYRAEIPTNEISACHCGMCRQWTGGPLIAVSTENLTWTAGEQQVRTRTTSPWAERAFCTECGSSLIYRITAEGPYQGHTTVTLGTLDDQSGFELVREYFIDEKPSAYTLEGEREQLTTAQVEAMFGDA
jgi:hypothetical protein